MLPDAVFFDFDGILVDTEVAIFEAWQETFREEGKELPLSLYTRCIGSDFDTWSPKTYLEELTGKKYDWVEMDAARQVVIRASLEAHGPMKDVVGLLEEIRSCGIPLAVVSSSAHDWVDGWLERLDLMEFFQEIVCRGDAPRIKPAPDLYLEAAKRFGLEPANCLVIEDSLNGLHAANEAGMRTWIVPNRVTAALDFSEAEAVLADFSELRKRLFGG